MVYNYSTVYSYYYEVTGAKLDNFSQINLFFKGQWWNMDFVGHGRCSKHEQLLGRLQSLHMLYKINPQQKPLWNEIQLYAHW